MGGEFFSGKERNGETRVETETWKVLVLEAGNGTRGLTPAAMQGFSFQGRPLEILTARNAGQGREAFGKHPDIALVLLDSAMHEGGGSLDLIDHIRQDLKNRRVRIVLRTDRSSGMTREALSERCEIDDLVVETSGTFAGLFSAMAEAFNGIRRAAGDSGPETRSNKLSAVFSGRPGEAEREFRLLLDSINAGIILIEPSTRKIVDINASAAEAIGAERGRIVGRLCHEFLCPAGNCTCPIIDRGQDVDNSEKILVDIHGKKIPILKTAKRIRLGNRELLLESFIDIRNWKDTEKERDQLRRQFLRSQKMESIGTLAGGIAHDFNNILAAVLGYTELALYGVEEGSALEENLQEVYKAGKRAKELVKQILTFARQTEGDTKPVQVSLIAKEVLKLIRSTIPASIEVKKKIVSNCLVNADPSRIHQIFMNLCANAAQAMEQDGGVLEISLEEERLDEKFVDIHGGIAPGDYLRIRVADTGTGIPEEVIPKIFDPYFTTKAPGEGTGLGLAVVHGIVKSYDGEVLVESRLGEGTVFSIYLPITKKFEEQGPLVSELLPTGTESILIIDDEEPLARLLGQLLEQQGYRVQIRVSPVEALQLLKYRADSIDLVVTDMEMPRLTGDQLTLEIKAIRSDMPVILCTGFSKKISKEKAKEIGLDGFLMKPVSKTALAKTVRHVLDDYRDMRRDRAEK